MKERIKKFYKENQETCVYAACLTLVATISTIIVRKGIDDMRIVAVGDKLEDGVHWIQIVHKNGLEDFWYENQEV
jgi:hypothetical protein